MSGVEQDVDLIQQLFQQNQLLMQHRTAQQQQNQLMMQQFAEVISKGVGRPSGEPNKTEQRGVFSDMDKFSGKDWKGWHYDFRVTIGSVFKDGAAIFSWAENKGDTPILHTDVQAAASSHSWLQRQATIGLKRQTWTSNCMSYSID